jgi:hypothetical protein
MKILECSGPNCGERRISWSNPYVKRGVRKIEVPDEVKVAFCSIECKFYYDAANKGEQE